MEKAKNHVQHSKLEASGNIEIGDKSTTNLTVNNTNKSDTSNTNIPVIAISVIALLLTYGVLTKSATTENKKNLTETPILNNFETSIKLEESSSQISIPLPPKPANKINPPKEKSNQKTTSTSSQSKKQAYYLGGYVFDSKTQKPLRGIEISHAGKTVISDAKGYFYLSIASLPATNMATLHFSGQGFIPYTKHYSKPQKDNINVYLQK